jgi:hypothetical protein
VLQEQLRVIVLPSDPVPIANPRPELFAADDNPLTSIGGSFNPLATVPWFGTMTGSAGLGAAFDSNANKPYSQSAVGYVSVNGNNTIGRNWIGYNPNTLAGIVAGPVTVTAPNNAKLFGGGAAAWVFQGSNAPIGFTTLSSGTTAGTIGEVLSFTPTGGTYLFHQFVITGDGINSVSVAQLQINALGGGSNGEI